MLTNSHTNTPPLVLAPLLGITTAPFRRIFARHFGGFDRFMAPFISVTHGKPPVISHFRDILPDNNRQSIPLIPQLIGKDGLDFAQTARRLHLEFGFDEINWNIGCPSPTVTSRTRGAGMLSHPDLIAGFLQAAELPLPCRFSIKMRLGMQRDDEYLALTDILNQHPISEITIHPRTGKQQYTGRADAERFADLKSRLSHPIAYNGDIRTTDHALAICSRFPDLSSLMIGRGAIANPWLPSAIKKGIPERTEFTLKALKSFHDDLFEEYRRTLQGGPGPVLGRMKEIWTYWEGNFDNGERIVRRVLKTRQFDEYLAAVDAAFLD